MSNINSFCMLQQFEVNLNIWFCNLCQKFILWNIAIFHKLAITYPFHGRGFHTSVVWKIGCKVINKQVIIQILMVNTAFYIYGNIRLSILNSFEQIQENTFSGSAARPRLSYLTLVDWLKSGWPETKDYMHIHLHFFYSVSCKFS